MQTTTPDPPAGYVPLFPAGTALSGLPDKSIDALVKRMEAGEVKWVVTRPADGEQQRSMTVSQNGRDLIKGYESAEPNPYQDSAGLLTIGVGHLLDLDHKNGVSKSEWAAYDALGYPRKNLTDEQMDGLFAHDLGPKEDDVNGMLKVPVTPEMFDSLVSLTFNIGPGKAGGKTGLLNSDLLAKLNKGDYDSLPAQFSRFVYAGGAKSKGLKRRRMKEVLTFAVPYVKDPQPTK